MMPLRVRKTLLVVIGLLGLSVAAGCWALSAPLRGPIDSLRLAQQRWQHSQPAHYIVRVRLLTMHSGQTARLEVRDEELVAGWSGSGTRALSANELQQLRSFFPMRRLFALAQRQVYPRADWREWLARGLPSLASWIELPCDLRPPPPLSYDPRLGYPRRMFIGTSPCPFDNEGIEIRIDQFQAVP